VRNSGAHLSNVGQCKFFIATTLWRHLKESVENIGVRGKLLESYRSDLFQRYECSRSNRLSEQTKSLH